MAYAQQLKKQLKSSICLLLGLRWAFGGGILGGCASSLPVLRIHPQFCHSRSLEQWYFERKKICLSMINLKGFEIFGFLFDSQSWTTMPPGVLRMHPQFCHSHVLDQWYFERIFFGHFKGFEILGFFFIHKFNNYPSLCPPKTSSVLPQPALDQWYFEREKGLLSI